MKINDAPFLNTGEMGFFFGAGLKKIRVFRKMKCLSIAEKQYVYRKTVCGMRLLLHNR